MLEKNVVDQIEQHLSANYTMVFREVPFLQRHVDIVGYDESSGRIIAIEAKIKNWREAVKQARTCLFFTDEVFIAMPKEFVHRVDLEILENYGIGLISVGENIIVEFGNKPSACKHKYHFEWMISLLERMASYKKPEGKNE